MPKKNEVIATCEFCDSDITTKQAEWEKNLNSPCLCEEWKRRKKALAELDRLEKRIEKLAGRPSEHILLRLEDVVDEIQKSKKRLEAMK